MLLPTGLNSARRRNSLLLRNDTGENFIMIQDNTCAYTDIDFLRRNNINV